MSTATTSWPDRASVVAALDVWRAAEREFQAAQNLEDQARRLVVVLERQLASQQIADAAYRAAMAPARPIHLLEQRTGGHLS